MASSRVGARISTLGPFPPFSEGAASLLRAGKRKAAVFPVPVCAEALMSKPRKIFGIAFA